MHFYDIIMVLILLGATIFGAWKGMAWQIAALSSLIVSYFVALRFSGDFANYFGWDEPWNRFLAMLLIYLATSLVIWLAFRMVRDFIERVRLKEFDRQLGALFGAAKGVVLCVALTFFAVTLSEVSRQKVLESRSGFYIAALLDKAHGVMPPELHEILHPYLHHLREELDTPPRSPRGGTGGRFLGEEQRELPFGLKLSPTQEGGQLELGLEPTIQLPSEPFDRAQRLLDEAQSWLPPRSSATTQR